MTIMRWHESVILKLHRAWLVQNHGPLEKFIRCQFPVDLVKKFFKKRQNGSFIVFSRQL